MLTEILAQYRLKPEAVIQPFGNGLINFTWRVSEGGKNYILQKINDKVFKEPLNIAFNIQQLSGYLKHAHREYFFVTPVLTENGESVVKINNEYYRLFPFVKNSTSYDVAKTPEHAFEAARQFGMFTKMLTAFEPHSLKITLQDFHNLPLRFLQFEYACKHGNQHRVAESKRETGFLEGHSDIVSEYNNITRSPGFKLRVTHHDTKISNLLFDEHGKGICVIDLDTVMPGYFISDVGDMMRTYLSPVSEEENDFTQIEIREEFFKAIVDGYLQQMVKELSNEEIRHFVYSGMFMIYMQALRFLTDHLNNDAYYGAAYEGQNLIRAKNQIILLQKLMEKEDRLHQLVMQLAGIL